MAKSVINLVRELGVKSTAEVLELLRQVGVDTEAEGFGVMSKVDDETVAKLHTLQNLAPPVAAPAPKPAPAAKPPRKSVSMAEETEADSGAKAPKRVTRDFFGTRKAPVAPPPSKEDEPEPAPAVEKPRPRPATTVKSTQPAVTAQTSAAPAAAHAPAQATASVTRAPKPPPAGKLDLSSGPRIISMPDPEEARRLRVQREQPQQATTTTAAPGSAAALKRKKGPVKPVTVEERKKDTEAAGRRKKIKEIGGALDDEMRVRSKKRVFKVAGVHLDAGPAVVPHIKIGGSMNLRDVAKAAGVKVAEIVKFLMRELGILSNINYSASVEEIQLIAENFGIQYTVSLDSEPESELEQFEHVAHEDLVARPPVVTVMGHVDHGKTKLLDAIRTTNVVAGEAGGITQHIGAYQVEKKGKHITFIDTPGHEAFTAMRARGSQVTDLVILVVAADDGVMPQTIEAINHAKAAQVPLIVAVNKIDKADANPDRVKTQLAEYGLVPEEWGGDTVFVNVSALKGENIDELLEMILLSAELIDPRSDPKSPPFGVVIESKVDIGIGVVATVLTQQGTMRRGQFILSGTHVGRIKRMENDRGEEVDIATPSMPVRIIGFSEPPENGDKVYSFVTKKQAQAIADQRMAEQRQKATAGASGKMSLEAFFSKAAAGETKDLNLVVKADVGGSTEALCDALAKLEVEGIKCNIIASGVGQVNESDVNLAAASGAVIIGFSVGVASTAKWKAEREHVDIRTYDIIYKVTEDIELAMKGLLAPQFEERALGRVEIRAIFKTSREGSVAGGYVLDGVARRGAKFRLRRGTQLMHENGHLNSLKRFKDDVREVASGFECGLLVDAGDATPQEGDILELYEVVEKARL